MEPIERIAAEAIDIDLDDRPIMTTADFARQADAVSAPYAFATSRSGTTAPYADTDWINRNCGDALRLLGARDDDVVANLLAPPPHLSGFAAECGVSHLGVQSLSSSFEAVEDLIATGEAAAATAVLSIPSKALALADEIADSHGTPASVFPRLEWGAFGGELLGPHQRRALRDRWGLEAVREFYGSSEAGLIAAGVDETRRLVPLLNHYLLELEVDGTLIDIRECEEPTVGSLVLTAPERSAVDLIRYRQGDRVRVHPGDPLPRIEPLGRVDSAVTIAGVTIHPGDIHRALEAVYDEPSAVVPVVDDRRDPTGLEVVVAGASVARADRAKSALVDAIPGLEHAETGDTRIDITEVDSIDAVDGIDTADIAGDQVVERSG